MFELFKDASNTVAGTDLALAVIVGMCAGLFVLTMGCMFFFAVKYRRSAHPRPRKVKEYLLLEITWTVVPLGLVMIMFVYGWQGYNVFRRSNPADAFHAHVTGRMWSWVYEYDNGVQITEMEEPLRLPVGKPINLTISSVDVNHSFYVPAFRIKQDAIPGFDNEMIFTINEPGTYDIYCAEYCGLQHAYMLSKIEAVPAEEFFKWYTEAEKKMKEEQAAEEADGEGSETEDSSETTPAEETAAASSSH